MKPSLVIEYTCDDPGCDSYFREEIAPSVMSTGSSVSEKILGLPVIDIAMILLRSGWSIMDIRDTVYKWRVTCWKHDMSIEFRNKIESLSRMEDWSDDYKKGFMRAISQHPKIQEEDFKYYKQNLD